MARTTRTSDRERGAALLEFVLVIPIFLYVLYSLIGFGLAISLKEDVTHASAEGARAAIGAQVSSQYPTQTQAWEAAASARVTSVLSWLDSDTQYLTVTQSVAACPTASDAGGMCLTVTVSYDYGDHPIIPNMPGLGYFNPSSLSSTATVQVQ